MARQCFLAPAITYTPTVTDLINRFSASSVPSLSKFKCHQQFGDSTYSTAIEDSPLGFGTCLNPSLTPFDRTVSVADAASSLTAAAGALYDASAVLSKSYVRFISLVCSPVAAATSLSVVSAALADVASTLANALSSCGISDLCAPFHAAGSLATLATAAEKRASFLASVVAVLEEVASFSNTTLHSGKDTSSSCSHSDFSVRSRVPCSEHSPKKANNNLESVSEDMKTSLKTPTAFSPKDAILDTFGYNVEDVLDRGSFSNIQVAWSRKHKSKVAVKVISKLTAPQKYVDKFLPREVEAARLLRHPNVVRFLQVIRTKYRVYFIMEYAEHGNLEDLIRKEGLIEESRGKLWFQQIVEAVLHCHGKGIAHRNITCKSLLLDARDNIKLANFNFASVTPAESESALSITFHGNGEHVAPEILQRVPYDPQLSDVWSMGIVLFVMIYGCFPFKDASLNAYFKRIEDNIVIPRKPNASSACKSLIRRMLAPEKRRIHVPAIRSCLWLENCTWHMNGTSKLSCYSEKQKDGNSDEPGARNSFVRRFISPMKQLIPIRKSHVFSPRKKKSVTSVDAIPVLP